MKGVISKEKTSKEAKSKTAKAAPRPSMEGPGQKETSAPGVEQSTNKNTSIKSPHKEKLRDGPGVDLSEKNTKRKKGDSSSQFLVEDSVDESLLEESQRRRQRKSGKRTGKTYP